MLPQDVLDREIERLVELGITIKTNTEVGKDVTWDDLKKNYDACVLAVGLTEPNSVRAEGENKDGVSTDFRSFATSAWARRRSSWARASPSSAAATRRSTARARRCGKAPTK